MFNPFKKRASEYMQDGALFLATVAPDPLFTFLLPHVQQGTVFDRLVAFRGTPGSGKTTIASLFRLTNIRTILRNPKVESTRVPPGFDRLQCRRRWCRRGGWSRIPMEAEYRDIWELPYPDDVKSKLLFTLIQARAVLLWLKDLRSEGEHLSTVGVESTGASAAAVVEAGIETAKGMRRRKRARSSRLSIG